MLAVISPAKRLDFDQAPNGLPPTNPPFPGETNRLVRTARKLSAAQLGQLMDISPDLATLNRVRFKEFKMRGDAPVQLSAVQAFKGDVYLGLDVDTLGEEQVGHLQDHLRILSGLYGVLRPSDLIQPYRLEMGSRLETDAGMGLYRFWGEQVTHEISKSLRGHKDPTLVNLASNEYFKVVKPKALPGPLLTINFKEYRDGEPVMISFNAKKARGLMARYIAVNGIDQSDDLRGFDSERYQFDDALSEPEKNHWCFSRKFIPVAEQ